MTHNNCIAILLTRRKQRSKILHQLGLLAYIADNTITKILNVAEHAGRNVHVELQGAVDGSQ